MRTRFGLLSVLPVLAALSLCACARHAAPAAAAAAASSPAATPSAAAAQTSNGSTSAASSTAAQTSAPPVSTADQSQSTTQSLEKLAAMPAAAQLPPNGRWKAGVNYDVISPAQPTVAKPGEVEVLEVFWLGCPHCYAFEPYIRAWLKKKPSYIQFVRVPVMWGPVHRLHAHLFYTLEALGRDDLVEKAFDTIHKGDNPLIGDTEQDTLEKQTQWAQANGVSADAFRKAYNSFGVQTSLEHAQDLTNRYHVTGVPEVIVAGKYSTDVGKAGGHAETIQLIDFLAAFEHHRMHKG